MESDPAPRNGLFVLVGTVFALLALTGCASKSSNDTAGLQEIPSAQARSLAQARPSQISQDSQTLVSWSGRNDVVVRDLRSDKTRKFKLPKSARRPANGGPPIVSADGRIVAVGADGHGRCYVFVHDNRSRSTVTAARADKRGAPPCFQLQSVANTGTVLYSDNVTRENQFTVSLAGEKREHKVFHYSRGADDITLSANGKYVLGIPNGPKAFLYDLKSGRARPYQYGKLMKFSNGGIVVSPNGRYADATYGVHDLLTGSPTKPHWGDTISFSADSRFVAYQTSEDISEPEAAQKIVNPTASVYDLKAGKVIYKVRQSDGEVSASRPVMLPNGHVVVEIDGRFYKKDLAIPTGS